MPLIAADFGGIKAGRPGRLAETSADKKLKAAVLAFSNGLIESE